MLLFCPVFLYAYAAFAIDEKREYKVQSQSQYFYFLGDTLFLETLAIDKPVRYTVDTFYRKQEGAATFYNARQMLYFEDGGFDEFRLVVNGPESHGRGIIYFAKPVSRKEKTNWNRQYNNIVIERNYQKVAAVKQVTDPLNSKQASWNRIHHSLQELNQEAEKYNRQEFEAKIKAIFIANACTECCAAL